MAPRCRTCASPMTRATDAPPPEPPPRSNPGYQYSAPREGRLRMVQQRDGSWADGPWVVELDASGLIYLDSLGRKKE